jgi:hypothetical protein
MCLPSPPNGSLPCHQKSTGEEEENEESNNACEIKNGAQIGRHRTWQGGELMKRKMQSNSKQKAGNTWQTTTSIQFAAKGRRPTRTLRTHENGGHSGQ